MTNFFPIQSEGSELAQLWSQGGGIQSATAAVVATSGTITTSGPPLAQEARINPAGNITAVVLQPGVTAGQEAWVINESANTVTFAASGTSNVADGSSDVIQANQARLYVWDSVQALWYSTPQIINTVALTQSGSAAALATSGTITTANVQVARINPGSAVSAVVLGSGTSAGQLCVVSNEAAVASSVTFAASGSSFVADGTSDVIPGLSAKLYVWDASLSAWVAGSPQLTNGTNFTLQSATAAALATSGTITTAGVGVARINPGSAVSAVVLGSGTIPGQQITVINEAAAANTVTFAASGSSFVADGVNCIIPGLQAKLFVWNGTNWYEITPLVGGSNYGIVSATAPALAISGTITTANLGVTKVTPGSAVTSCVLAQGVYAGQQITVLNASTTGANTINFAASASSFVADGGTTAISGLRCATYVWDGTNWNHS